MPAMTENIYSFCRICEVACGLIVSVENNRIIDIRPDDEHVASRGFACKKGLRFHEIEHSPDRLRFPLKRNGSTWERISWKQALKEIGEKVKKIRKEHSRDSIAMYVGNGAGFSLPHAFGAQGFMDAVGSRSIYSASSQDCSNKFAVARHMYGTPVLQTYPDIDRTDCLILIGANPAASKFSFASAPRILDRLKGIEKRGGQVFHVNPRKTETARVVGEQVFIKPGTDLFFLLAFARELIRRGYVDSERVKLHMKNFDRFQGVVEPWTPDRAESVTGIPARDIIEMVKAYGTSEGAALYCSTGVNQGPYPSLCFWILEAVNAVSGNLDRFGGTLVGKGIIDLPGMTKKTGTLLSSKTTRIGNFPAVMDCLPGAVLHDEILTPGEGQIRALFVTGGNPLITLPDSSRFEQALKELELVVSVDIFRNETGNLAHYVLPATSFMQHADINFLFHTMLGMMNEPFLGYTDRILEPEEEERDEFWIYRELARSSGVPMFGSRALGIIMGIERVLGSIPLLGRAFKITYERIFDLILRFAAKLSVRKMRKYPHGMPLDHPGENSFLGKRVLTDDGLVDLAPPVIMDFTEKLDRYFETQMKIRDAVKLVNKRETLSHNSYFHNGESFVSGNRHTNYLYMNTGDAAKIQVVDGDLVQVKTETGSVAIPVKVTDDMMPGVVAVPHGWGHGSADGLTVARKNGGVNINLITPSGPDSVEYISGMVQLTALPVEVVK